MATVLSDRLSDYSTNSDIVGEINNIGLLIDVINNEPGSIDPIGTKINKLNTNKQNIKTSLNTINGEQPSVDTIAARLTLLSAKKANIESTLDTINGEQAPEDTIASRLSLVSEAKSDIATAIVSKGGVIPVNASFRDYATAIDNLQIKYIRTTLTINNGSAQLIDRAVQLLNVTSGSTVSLTLPSITSEYVTDFIVDVINSTNSALTITLNNSVLIDGQASNYKICIKDGGDSLSDMLSIDASGMVRLYFTLTSFVDSSLPVVSLDRVTIILAQ